MQGWIRIASVTGILTAVSHAAEEPFSKAIPAQDFSAAGLAKLAPEELARLDRLVRDFKSGALEAARREAAVAVAAREKAEAKAARAEAEVRTAQAEAQVRAQDLPAKKSEAGLLAQARVLLTPGTQIDYATLESRIVGEFRGWQGRTIFTLENGQRWQSAGETTYVTPPVMNPAVRVGPGVLGAFWMNVEGVKQRVKVVPLAASK